MTTDLVAFLDESKKPVRSRATGKVANKGEYYVVAGAVVFDGEIDCHRTRITKLETELGFKLHYSELSTSRRREALQAIAELEGWEAHLFESRNPIRAGAGAEHHTRAKVLAEAFTYLSSRHGVARVVLETRSQPSQGFETLDRKDNQVLQKLMTHQKVPRGFSIRHESKTEPILGLADIVAGARTDHLCAVNEAMYPLVAHLVHEIRKVG